MPPPVPPGRSPTCPGWPSNDPGGRSPPPPPAPAPARPRPRDIQKYYRTAAWFYLTIIGVTLAWWLLRWIRARQHAVHLNPARRLVPETVLQAAETRWAYRVLGCRTPEGSPDTRFSNAPVEANFVMQLRAIYKLGVEWRRRVNGWAEADPKIVENGEDGWLNGLDEFAVMVGITSAG